MIHIIIKNTAKKQQRDGKQTAQLSPGVPLVPRRALLCKFRPIRPNSPICPCKKSNLKVKENN
jgi:hypothetical protein